MEKGTDCSEDKNQIKLIRATLNKEAAQVEASFVIGVSTFDSLPFFFFEDAIGYSGKVFFSFEHKHL